MSKLETDYVVAVLSALPNHELKSTCRVHKLFYLLIHLFKDWPSQLYSYEFTYYGIYSYQLQRIIENDDRIGIVPKDQNGGFCIFLDSFQFDDGPSLSSDQQEVVTQLAALEPTVLRVLTTIVYLDSHFYSGKQIRTKITRDMIGYWHWKVQPNQLDEACKLAKQFFNISTT